MRRTIIALRMTPPWLQGRYFQQQKSSTKWFTIADPFSMLNHMVEFSAHDMNSVFHALADATRRRMLADLAGGERTIGQLAEPFDMSLAAASKHVKVLEGAGLIRREVRGRTHLCRLDPGPLASAHDWLTFYERFWNNRLDALERLLREEDRNPEPKQGEEPNHE
jgi:DNA-binding transcriptional ArsR family regulator